MEFLSSPDIILWIQQFKNSVLDYFFIAVTWMGNEDFFLLAIPIVYWCIDKKFGFKLGVFFLLSAYVNELIKGIFMTPRPDPAEVRVLYPQSGGGYSFPSGHSQGAAVFWGAIAWEAKRAWVWIVAVVLILLIGVSRLYLGVHWPIDVLGGWAIGAVLLGLLILYDVTRPAKGHSIKTVPAIVAAVAAGAVLFFIYSGDNAARVIGTLVGMAIGYVLQEEYFPFEPRSVWWYQIVKVVVGLAVAFGIRIVVKMVLPDAALSHVIRYFLIGLWISAAVPFIFRGRKA
jgi:membrane-associated phospholipid phosphatase